MPQAAEVWSLEFDHVIAQSHGGPTTADNLALACFYCNNHKGTNLAGIDPDSRKIVVLFNPRRQQWRRHFRYDGPVLIGRTAAGHTTAAALRINSMVRIGQRRGWIAEGLFRTT